MGFTVGAILLVGAIVYFILQPLLTGMRASLERTEDELSDAEARRRVTLKALRDVEYDYMSGKLDERDYGELKRELSAEALEAMKAVEQEEDAEAVEAALEEEIRKVREGLRTGSACPGCGHANPPGSRFCGACGHPLESAASGPVPSDVSG